MSWYAIQHKPGQGERALDNLQYQDVRCFYPKIAVEKIQAGKCSRRLEPLFPGYLFINIDQRDPLWAKLRSTRGVLRLVSFANKPATIDDDVIDHIRHSLDTVTEHGGIKPGDTLQLQNGPFSGLDAVFQAYDGQERAIVLISFMQRMQRVKVSVSALKR